jgi:hypothetical protein
MIPQLQGGDLSEHDRFPSCADREQLRRLGHVILQLGTVLE